MIFYRNLLILLLSLLSPILAILTMMFFTRLSPHYSQIISLLKTSKHYRLVLGIVWSLSMMLVYFLISTDFCMKAKACSFHYYFPGALVVLSSNFIAVLVGSWGVKHYL